MSWENPTKEEHKDFSSCYQVWYGACPHENWDMRWYHERTYKVDGPALSLARKLQSNRKAVRVVQCWWDGASYQTEIIYEA